MYVCVLLETAVIGPCFIACVPACLTEASQRGSVAITLATGHSAAGPHPLSMPHLRDEIFSVHVLQPEQPLSLSITCTLYFCLAFYISSSSSSWLRRRRSRQIGKSRGPPTHPQPVAPTLPWADCMAVMPPQTSPAQLPCLSSNGHPACHKRGYFCAGMTCRGGSMCGKASLQRSQLYREMWRVGCLCSAETLFSVSAYTLSTPCGVGNPLWAKSWEANT